MNKPISIYLTDRESEEMKTNNKCDHSYLILLNDKLRKSQDEMSGEMKLIQNQNNDLEYESDRMEKTIQNLRGISKNFILLNNLYKKLNNSEKLYTKQLEEHSEYLRHQINQIFKKLIMFVAANVLIYIILVIADIISVAYMTCTIILYASVVGVIHYTKYIEHIYDLISPVDKRLVQIKREFSGDISTTKTMIKKINKSTDFLNDLVDLM